MLLNVLKRFAYVTDASAFYDLKTRKEVSETQILKKAQQEDPRFESIAEAASLLQSMKMTGQDFKTLFPEKKKKSNSLALSEAYETIAPHITLRVRYQGGVPLLYNTNERLEVEYITTGRDETFKSIVLADDSMRKACLQEFEFGAHAEFLQQNFIFADFVKKLWAAFEGDNEKILSKEPPLISWEPDEYAYRKFDSDIIAPGATPNWDSFLSRMNYSELFKAFVWSIFDPKNFGRQALWLQGEGSDGKSSAINAITEFFGRDRTLSMGMGSVDSDFFFGEAYGKRLAVYMDCKNPQILRKERIKSLLGKDTVSINKKNEKQFSAQLYSRLIVASNWLPQINYNDNSERSRLLLLQVRSYNNENGDPDFEDNLKAEMPHFLHSCKEVYRKYFPNGMNATVPESMALTIKTLCSANDSDLLEQFIDEKLEFGKNFYVSKTMLQLEFKTFFSKNWASADSNFSLQDLQRLLLAKGMDLTRAKLRDGSEPRVLCGLRIRGTDNIIERDFVQKRD